MRWEFGLGDVVVAMFHGHGKEDTSEGGVNNGRGNSFNERVKTVKVENGQNSIWKSCERHPQGNAKVSG